MLKRMTIVTTLLLPILAQASDAATPPDMTPVQIRQAAMQTAKAYADAISCGGTEIKAEFVLPLRPWVDRYLAEEAEYLVIWNGDIGCAGGSGTWSDNIVSVQVGAGGTFYVEPRYSSPVIDFDSGMRIIEQVSLLPGGLLRVQGLSHGEDDANNFPSQKVSATLQRLTDGGWRPLSGLPSR